MFSDHMERGLELGCLIAKRECQSRSKIFTKKKLDLRSVPRQVNVGLGNPEHSVLGQNISGAGRCGAELRGAGRHWGNIPGAERSGAAGQWDRMSWGRT